MVNDAGNYSVAVSNSLGTFVSTNPAVLTVNPVPPGSVVVWPLQQVPIAAVPVAAQSAVTVIAAGILHTVALKTNGSVVAWGRNATGEATVPDEAQSGVIAIAAGGDFDDEFTGHTLALTTNGSVLA